MRYKNIKRVMIKIDPQSKNVFKVVDKGIKVGKKVKTNMDKVDNTWASFVKKTQRRKR
jgi:hypothetical protein